MKKKGSTEILYGMVALILLIVSLMSRGSVDFAIDDTYYVISNFMIFAFLAVVYGLFAIISLFFSKINRPLSTTLSLIHFFITTLALLISTRMIYSTWNSQPEGNNADYNFWIALILLIGFFAQFIFVFNILRALIKQKKTLNLG